MVRAATLTGETDGSPYVTVPPLCLVFLLVFSLPEPVLFNLNWWT